MHAIFEYLHELKKEKLRMFLTVVGVCWGMANIVLMLSVGEGLYRSFGKGMRGMGEGIVVVFPRQTSKAYAGFGLGRRIRITEEDVRQIKQLVPGIKEISAQYTNWSINLRTEKRNLPVQVSGVYPCYGEMRNQIPEPGGRFINRLDEENKRRVIFLGNKIRDKLFGEGTNPVGKTVLFNEIPFTVIGVMTKKIQMSSYSGMDENFALIPASAFRIMFSQKYLNNVVFSPRSPGESKAAQDGFRKVMAARYRFDPKDKDTFWMWDTIEMNRLNGVIFRGIQIFLGIIGGLTLVIAGIGVANIMYVTVKERTREIGIKMAVGARPGYIIGQFVIEALLTVSLGGALGIGLGLGMIEAFKALPIEHQIMEFLGKPVFSALLALICSTILTFIGLISGVFPANRASKVNPVVALRYE
jgi:putative ABC transport system permease protein